ncbi:MAG: MAPEG family protein [Burkholderiales bacterium]|nr:MAPEG family protein [Burkholderiales bacterium]
MKPERQRRLARSAWFTVPGTFVVLGAAYAVVPPMPGLETPSQRLVLAVQWLVVAMLPYAAVCLHILGLRFFEGAHNPLQGAGSERLQIHCRVLQNTLEQLVWFALCTLALATLLQPQQVQLVPIVCVFFAVARFIYWWGYLRDGTLGRAPGVQLTFTLNVALLAAVIVRLVRQL